MLKSLRFWATPILVCLMFMIGVSFSYAESKHSPDSNQETEDLSEKEVAYSDQKIETLTTSVNTDSKRWLFVSDISKFFQNAFKQFATFTNQAYVSKGVADNESSYFYNAKVRNRIQDCAGSSNGQPTYYDYDGDGVANPCDEDDDNDGILDAYESWYFCEADFLNYSFSGTIDGSRERTSNNHGFFKDFIFGDDFTFNIDFFVENGPNDYHPAENDVYIQTLIGDYATSRTGTVTVDGVTKSFSTKPGEFVTISHDPEEASFYSIRIQGVDASVAGIRLSRKVDQKTIARFDFGTPTSPVYSDQHGSYIPVVVAENNPSLPYPSGRVDVDCSDYIKRDTDGDSIEDYRDADSDNDGCPDALEGTGNVSLSDIDPNWEVSGGVDNNGLPLFFNGTSQRIGTANDENHQAISCGSACDSNDPDSDGDGVADDCDLDKDNDGILNTDEGCIDSTTLDFNDAAGTEATPGSPKTFSLGFGNGMSANVSISADIGTTLIEADGNTTFATRDDLGEGSGIRFYPNGISSTSQAAKATVDFGMPVYNLKFVVTDVDVGNGASDETFLVEGKLNGNLVTLTPSNVVRIVNPTPQQSGNLFDGTGSNSSNVFLIQYDQPIDEISFRHSIDISSPNYANVVKVFDFHFDLPQDTDGDSIIDCLDTDSDNDGCPDALEGDGSFTYSDLNNENRLTGTDSDGDGVIDNSEQGVGTSTDSTRQSEACTACDSNAPDSDGDGVSDDCDIDIDNDGISNIDEGCEYPGKIDFNDYAGESVTAGEGVNSFWIDYGSNDSYRAHFSMDAAFGTTALEADGQGAFADRDPTGNGGSGINLYPNGINNANRHNWAKINFYRPVHNVKFAVTDVDLGNGASDELLRIKGFYEGNEVVLSPSNITPISGPIPSQNGNEFIGTGASPENVFIVEFSQPIDLLQFEFTITSSDVNYANPAKIFDIDFTINKDSDNDGIPNCYDLDSDNDRCYDAIEGSGSYSHGDLNADGRLTGTDSDGDGMIDGADQGPGISYSPLSQSPECSSCDPSSNQYTDTDSDGVADDCDLDADNDGILNSEEGCYEEATIEFSQASGLRAEGGETKSFSITYGNGFVAQGEITADVSATYIEGDGNTTFAVRDSLGDGSGIMFYPNGIDNANDSNTATIKFGQAVHDLKFIVTDIEGGNGQSSELFTISAKHDGQEITLTPENIIPIAGPPPTQNGNVFNGYNTRADNAFLVTYFVPVDEITFINSIDSSYPNYANTVKVFDFYFKYSKDFDGDGIPNCLDTDSDDDGCPDAVEGTGDFTLDDLNNEDRLTGPDSDGDGIIDGVAQNVGDSQDADVTTGCIANSTIAENDINQTPKGVPATGNVLTNDKDPEGDTQTITGIDTDGDGVVDVVPVAGSPIVLEHGTLVINPATGEYTFTPNSDFTGTQEFFYQVCDDGNPQACDMARVSIEVLPEVVIGENNPPVAQNDNFILEQGQTISGNILSNDHDIDGDDLTVTNIAILNSNGEIVPLSTDSSNPSQIYDENGVLAGTGYYNPTTGYIEFTADDNYIGEVPIGYEISDGNGGTDVAIIHITVEGYDPDDNDTYALDDTNTSKKGENQTGSILANDYDPEGDTQSITSVSDSNGNPITIGTTATLPSGGQFTVQADGSYEYIPDANFVGTEVLTYQICDDGTPQACDTATIYLTTLEVAESTNTTFANDDVAQTPKSVAITGDILNNDYDHEGDNQSVSMAYADTDGDGLVNNEIVLGNATTVFGLDNAGAIVEAGQLVINANGISTFTPNNTFVGKVPAKYTVIDDNAVPKTDDANILITVLDEVSELTNSVVAVNDTNTTFPGSTVVSYVLSNDSDPQGDDFALMSALAMDSSGGFTVSLGDDPANPVTISAEDPANPGSYVTAGTAYLAGATIVYTADANFIGEVQVVYTIEDSGNTVGVASDTAILNITVKEMVDGNTLFANDDAVVGPKNVPLSTNILENDYDNESDDFSITKLYLDNTDDGVDNPTMIDAVAGTSIPVFQNSVFVGELTISSLGEGGTTLNPETDFVGTITVPYQIQDTTGDTAQAQVQYTFLPIVPLVDFTPRMTLYNTEIVDGQGNIIFYFTVEELLKNSGSIGPMTLRMKRSEFLTFTYEPNATQIGNQVVTNSDWVFDDTNPVYWIWTTDQVIEAGSFSTAFAFQSKFDSQGTSGKQEFEVQIPEGAGGDSDISNNKDFETIEY